MNLSDIERKELTRYMGKYDFLGHISGKTFLITGCKGMIGEAFIKWLLLENEEHSANVNIIASTRKPEETPNYIDPSDKISFCRFGYEREVLDGVHVDYIIHCAAPTGRDFFINNPVETFRVIVDSTENMLTIARENEDCRMLFLSSVEAYGLPDTSEPLPESYVGAIDSLEIRNGYPLGKKAAEFLCFAASREYSLDIKIVRPSSIHGLFQSYSEPRVYNEVLRCLIEKRNLVMKSDGLTKKSLIYTLDAISALFLVLFKGEKGQAYNVTDPSTFLTIRDVTERMFSAFSDGLRIEYILEDRAKNGYLPHQCFTQDVNKIKQLGWSALTSLEEIYEIDLKRFLK